MPSSSTTLEFAILAKSMNFNLPVKLDRDNYIYCNTQALPAIEAFELDDFIIGSKPIPRKFVEIQSDDGFENVVINKEYTSWKWSDKPLMCWLLSIINQTIIGDVTSCATFREVWKVLADLYSSRSLAKVL